MRQALTEAATALAGLLDRENAALAACDLRAAAAMLEAKQEALAAFALALGGTNTAPPPPALQELAARLATAARENRRLLEHGIAVQGRVLAMVLRAIPRPAPAAGYSAAGLSPAHAAPCTAPMALSVRA